MLRRLIQGIRKGSESVARSAACYAMIIRRTTKTVLHGPWHSLDLRCYRKLLQAIALTPEIGVGKSAFIADWPSLRTGRADLPHPALRLMGPLQGLTRELMGLGQGIQA